MSDQLTPDQKALAKAMAIIERLVDTHAQAQAYAMTEEAPPTPMQQWLAFWGIK